MINEDTVSDGWVCLYQAIIPENFIVNDNHGQHYRVHQRNLEWLTWQYESIKNGFFDVRVGRGANASVERIATQGPMGFIMPDPRCINELFEGTACVSIRCEVWKVTDRRFDPQNYAKTFKAPLDMLVHDGYIQDDSWRFVDGITYAGGGPMVIKRMKAADNMLGMIEKHGLNGALDLPLGDGMKGTCDAVFDRRSNVDGGHNGVRSNDILIRILMRPSQG